MKKVTADQSPANHTIPATFSRLLFFCPPPHESPPSPTDTVGGCLQDPTENVRTAVDTNCPKRAPDEQICTQPAGVSPDLGLTKKITSSPKFIPAARQTLYDKEPL